MSGNVWEWTRSRFQDYPYDPADGREALIGSVPLVLRGGGFNTFAGRVRSAFRSRFSPFYHNPDFGFRVVVSPFSP